jgi:tryptophanyl-tRNA synthetase
MAADILLYNASYVPVGDDQTQHLEFTRDIAMRMNNKFGDIFAVPETVAKQHSLFGKDQGLRIKDLVDPTKKMSKSDDTGKGVIFLGDDPVTAAKKIMSATTDDLAEVHFNRDTQPGISNLLEILALLRGVPRDDVVREFEGQTRYGDFKKVVADEVQSFLTDFQARLASVSDADIYAKLESSEAAMRLTANATLLRTQQAVGLRPRES